MTAAAGRLARVVLSGYFLLMVLFLYAPIVVLVVFSFNNNTTPTLPLAGFTTHWYHIALGNDLLLAAVKRSAAVAGLNGLLATLLAILAALALSAPRVFARPLVVALVMLPLVVPYVVLGVGMLVLLKTLGLGQSLSAVLFVHVVVSVPYGVLVILPRLQTLDPAIGEAARDLGAGEISAFTRVTLPLIVPAILSSYLIAFTISFDEYAIASFLVPAGHDTFPIFLYSNARTPALRPQTVAIAGLVVAVSLMIVIAAEVGRRYAERRLEGA
ncbi:MAG TPA: ABC transporter permease [Gaiellales bacterium]|jgi:spermidine/putrescine transport system permease protein|nr:ABC transporter permease [Gaiellales bacterium]